MKKIFTFVICLTMLLAAGCQKKDNSSTAASMPSGSASSSAPEESSEEPSESEEDNQEILWPTITIAEDTQIRVELEGFRGIYTTDEVIDLSVVVTNIGDTPITYVAGSGSNTVPDALQIELDGLIPLYIPVISTLDYQVRDLEAGQSVTFTSPFVPYRTEQENFVAGTDKDIKYFQDNEEFLPAEPGEIQGTLRFSYFPPSEESQQEMLFAEEDAVTVEGAFSIEIQ